MQKPPIKSISADKPQARKSLKIQKQTIAKSSDLEFQEEDCVEKSNSPNVCFSIQGNKEVVKLCVQSLSPSWKDAINFINNSKHQAKMVISREPFYSKPSDAQPTTIARYVNVDLPDHENVSKRCHNLHLLFSKYCVTVLSFCIL